MFVTEIKIVAEFREVSSALPQLFAGKPDCFLIAANFRQAVANELEEFPHGDRVARRTSQMSHERLGTSRLLGMKRHDGANSRRAKSLASPARWLWRLVGRFGKARENENVE